MTESNTPMQSPVHLRFTGEIVTDRARALEIQEAFVEFVHDIGGAMLQIAEVTAGTLRGGIVQDSLPESTELPEVDRSLDKTMAEVLSAYKASQPPSRALDNMVTRTGNMISRASVKTIRELLAVGRNNFLNFPTVHAGTGTIKLINASLQYHADQMGGEIKWMDEPTDEDIVNLYPDIYSVCGTALEPDLVGMSLNELLTTTIEDLAEKFSVFYYRYNSNHKHVFVGEPGWVQSKKLPDIDRARRVQEKAREHAARLLAVKASMQRQ